MGLNLETGPPLLSTRRCLAGPLHQLTRARLLQFTSLPCGSHAAVPQTAPSLPTLGRWRAAPWWVVLFPAPLPVTSSAPSGGLGANPPLHRFSWSHKPITRLNRGQPLRRYPVGPGGQLLLLPYSRNQSADSEIAGSYLSPFFRAVSVGPGAYIIWSPSPGSLGTGAARRVQEDVVSKHHGEMYVRSHGHLVRSFTLGLVDGRGESPEHTEHVRDLTWRY
jgi:hypothetical protein